MTRSTSLLSFSFPPFIPVLIGIPEPAFCETGKKSISFVVDPGACEDPGAKKATILDQSLKARRFIE
ncbi:MAG: hypothetical protein ABR605_09215 [Desulfurivibrionaceae bacterium]